MGIPDILQRGLLVVKIRAILDYAAKNGTFVKYIPLADSLKVFSGGKQLAIGLLDVMKEDHRERRPLTCALVVSSVTSKPGRGFFEEARALGYQMPDGEDKFWQAQVQALHSNPLVGPSKAAP